MSILGKIATSAARAIFGPTPLVAFQRVVNGSDLNRKIEKSRSVLVIKLDEIGDFVLASPFLRELRRGLPDAKIILAVNPFVYNLAEKCPYADEILAIKPLTGPTLFAATRDEVRFMRDALGRVRKLHVDAAIVPRFDIDSYGATKLAVYSGAKKIIAYSEAVSPEKAVMNRGHDRLIADVITPAREGEHEVRSNLYILEKLGLGSISDRLEVWLTREDREFARRALPEGCSYVGFGTGASKLFKRWPIERFSEIAASLRADRGLASIVLGAANDPVIPGALNLTGRTTLRQAAAILERCALFIGNDSGLKHIAAAVNIPIVEINPFRKNKEASHPSSPSRFRAWCDRQTVIQPTAGDGDWAIEQIEVSEVQRGIEEVLNLMKQGVR